jgi:hypothetical protein
MNVLIIHKILVQRISLSTQPRKTLMIYKSFKGVDWCNQDIDTHVEFVTIYQKRIRNVSLENYWFRKYNVFQLVYKLYASTSW